MTEELHELRLIAASLRFVEERSELLVIEFYPCCRAAISDRHRASGCERAGIFVALLNPAARPVQAWRNTSAACLGLLSEH